MRSTLKFIPAAALAGGLLFLTSCSGGVVVVHRTPAPAPRPVIVQAGPPPHAPAHGYRHKRGNLVLVYDAHYDVYIVDGHAGYYYCRDRYYRVRGNTWQVSFDFGGPWRAVPSTYLPNRLYECQVASEHPHSHGPKKQKYKGK